jgi:hypothetical protein
LLAELCGYSAFMQPTEPSEKDSLMTEGKGGNDAEPTEKDSTNRHLGRFAYHCIYRYALTEGASSWTT